MVTSEKELNEEVVEEVIEPEVVEAEVVESEEVEAEEKKEKSKLFSKKDKEDEYKTRIAELEGECAKLKNEYLKAYADTENTRKRLQADFDMRQKYRIQSFASEILPVIDNLERALSQTGAENEGFMKGIQMIYDQLMLALSKEGVEVVNPVNEAFDANFHQALMAESVEGVESNQVIEVLQKGYKLKDRILRAAMVKVSE